MIRRIYVGSCAVVVLVSGLLTLSGCGDDDHDDDDGAAPVAPSITMQPADQAVAEGQTAAFTSVRFSRTTRE